MPTLPIYQCLSQLFEALNYRDEAVLQAPPGAGKTTVVPLALLDQPWLQKQKIIILEPRRIAAKAAAERMATSLGESVGETVGYRIRMDTCVSQYTRIEVITEGILTRILQEDPSLEGVGLVIFDEFHERSLDADLGLALCLQSRALFRDDIALKLLVMSATLDTPAISTLLNHAPIIHSEGRTYPVDIFYTAPWQANQPIEPRVVKTILQALDEQQGSLLVFLPGLAEIQRVEEQLQAHLTTRYEHQTIEITPLYGDLSLQQQKKAISPPKQGHRKVVLTTSIAETSLTIEGINIVIDSGLSRQAIYDTNTGMTRLHTRRVSRSTSEQRAGRAGRLEAGVCYRLWSKAQQEQLAPFTPPEISQADLTPLVLQLHQWGCKTPNELSWIDPPSPSSYQQAQSLLHALGALHCVESGFQLTPEGQLMAALPLHPRLAKMLLVARHYQLENLACDLAAMFSERDPIRSHQADIQLRLDWLLEPPRTSGQAYRIKQQSQRLLTLCKTLPKSNLLKNLPTNQQLGLLIASAWPDRLAKKKAPGVYQLANGRAAHLNQQDYLSQQGWLAVAQLGGKESQTQDKIWQAVAFDSALLQQELSHLIYDKEFIEWDETAGKIIAEQRQYLGKIILSKQPMQSPPEHAHEKALLNYIRQRGLNVLPWDAATIKWRQRVTLASTLLPDNYPWPDLSDSALLNTLETWLQPYLAGCKSLEQLAKLDMRSILISLLPWELTQQLNTLIPEKIKVPSGSLIPIDYSTSPPVLAVKLQEMFGLNETPTIASKVTLQVHLLSPAGRPLQVTQDLEHFWQNVYPQVKKEMKGRYPKHPWPDNPLDAIATGKTKRHLAS